MLLAPLRVVLLAALLALAGCNCGGPPVDQPDASTGGGAATGGGTANGGGSATGGGDGTGGGTATGGGAGGGDEDAGTGGGGGSGDDGGTADAGPPPLTVDAGADVGSCLGGSATIGPAPTAGLTYAWAPTTGLSDATVAQPTANPTTTTTYTLTVTDTLGRTATDDVVVRVHPVPVVSAGPDRLMGTGGQVALAGSVTGGTAPFTPTWSSPDCTGACLTNATSMTAVATPATDATFTLSVVDANGCTGSDAATVTLTSALTPNAGADVALCVGDSVSLGLIAGGGAPPYTYAWSASPACAVPGCLSSATGASVTATPQQTTTFSQLVTDGNGDQATATATVTVRDDPGTVSGERFVQPGAALQVGPAPVAGATYTWTCDRPACALTDAALANPLVSPTRSTRYALASTSGPGCEKTGSVVVWALLQPTSAPEDGEAAWPVSAPLRVRFDVAVDPASVTASTVVLSDALTGTPVPTTVAYDAATRTLLVTPPAAGASYAADTDYTLTLSGGPTGVRSDDAVRPNILRSDLTIDFTTGAADTTPPAITTRSPGVNATGVALNTAVIAYFDEPVLASSFSTSTATVASGGALVTATVTFDFADNAVTLRPAADLAPTTTYTVTLTGVSDYSGNTATFTWSFTTGAAPDVTPPAVTQVSPANGAMSVASNAPVAVTFSEPIAPATLPGFRVTLTSSGAQVPGAVTWNAATSTATFTPSQPYESLAGYTVTVAAVEDLAGNVMPAPFTSTFTTRLTLFRDDFETGLSRWTTPTVGASTWGLATNTFRSATHSLTDSPQGRYQVNETTVAEVATALPVTGLAEVSLQFAMRTRTEKNRDFVFVDYQLDGGAWVPMNRPGTTNGWNGNSAWANYTLTIPTAGAASLRFRFRLTTNQNRNFDGVYVDDVLVQSP